MLTKEDKWSAFGHYEVQGSTDPIYSLRLAHEQAAQGKHIKFNFHDKLFAALKPSVDPVWSLNDLYARRVAQLRKKYDYLVLLYSGGADSHNILKWFQHTDTKLDEIISYEDSSYRGKDSPISSEIFGVALPEVKQHLERYPDTVYRLIELRDVQKKLFTDKSFNFDVYTDITYNMQPIGIKHAYGLCYVDKYRDLHNAGLKVGVIHGIDKPKIAIDAKTNKWMMYFMDWSSQFGHKHYFRDYPFYDEFFYWTPDDPFISIKQAHVITKHLDYLDSIGFESDYRLDQAVNVLPRKNGSKINFEWLNPVIYPFWDKSTFSVGKNAESFVASNRDPTLAISNDELLDPYKKSVAAAMQLATKVAPLTLKDISTTISNELVGLKPYRSSYHFLE